MAVKRQYSDKMVLKESSSTVILEAGLLASRISITWKFIRNEESQTVPQNCWIRTCILMSYPGTSYAPWEALASQSCSCPASSQLLPISWQCRHSQPAITETASCTTPACREELSICGNNLICLESSLKKWDLLPSIYPIKGCVCVFKIFTFYLFLAASVLPCSTRELCCSMQAL